MYFCKLIYKLSRFEILLNLKILESRLYEAPTIVHIAALEG